jgi:hypothetical protein
MCAGKGMMNAKELGALFGGIAYTDFLCFESANLLRNFFMYGWSQQLVQVPFCHILLRDPPREPQTAQAADKGLEHPEAADRTSSAGNA